MIASIAGGGRRLMAAALFLLLAACASNIRPLSSGRSSPDNIAAVIPKGAPKTTGVETAAAAERRRLLNQFGGEYQWSPAQSYLNGVLARLAAASDNPSQVYHVTLLNSPIVNAFAFPSGDLYATRGLLALANDTSEVAAVMAHEIGHVIARHAAKREELKRNEALFQEVAQHFEGPARAAEVEQRNRLSFAHFSRQQEYEADKIGIRTIAKAGYDAYGAARFLQSLERSAALKASLLGQRPGDEQPDLLSTHPTTPDRIARAIEVARKYGRTGTGVRQRAAYLAAINGITFGNDPNEGYIDGRTFIHARLGFVFTAPPGFILDNSTSAVLGFSKDGSAILRLDNVSVPAGETLLAYLTSGWVSGIDKSSLKRIMVNGLQAAIGTAKTGDWNYRFADIRIGAHVIRLIFAMRSINAVNARQFLNSIKSVRRLSSEEQARVRPLRIKIVRAGKNDTVDSLAAEMALGTRPLDNFLLLNGLKRGQGVNAGEPYKIVTH